MPIIGCQGSSHQPGSFTFVHFERAFCVSASPRSNNNQTRKILFHLENILHIREACTKTTTILDNVTINVPAHCFFAIDGLSGSGKSILLNMLIGIDRLTKGRIIFASRELQLVDIVLKKEET
jgi:ABC-type oligopeptide transport system ATPase subunit